ncbi:MAG: FAD-binding protein [Thermoguttaceae bacterium]|nr:FAD-binding protein [Thermoguttaceae bacterium]
MQTHTLIIGSGAAGLAAAIQLHRRGITDVLIATESLAGGTSINTGSDKQTYYKLSLCGADADSVRSMAETYFAGGSMHGDLALAEAANSVRAFMNLVELGIPFPTDEFGQFVGYKTDHDPRQRATSIGPYTSREMCRAMIREVQKLGVPIRERWYVKELLVDYDPVEKTGENPVTGRVRGAVFFVGNSEETVTVEARNVIFAVGGPGGLYRTSVYPKVHTGAIGVALAAGACAQNLPESQFGLASIGFRWNVSGTYMQCVPRFVSTAPDGVSDEREFLEEYAERPGEMLPLVFLKGYQWPFDSRKTRIRDGAGVVRDFGSSMIDIWVYVETVLRGRRVWLDFTRNPAGFSRQAVGPEAWDYLAKSGAADLPTPLARLEKMNPAAIEMYAEHGINIRNEKLEVAVCAQHNNGGLAADVNWESVNIRGLFPIGEVNGSHGVYRPGGSALNAGQVGAIRAAGKIKADSEEQEASPERGGGVHFPFKGSPERGAGSQSETGGFQNQEGFSPISEPLRPFGPPPLSGEACRVNGPLPLSGEALKAIREELQARMTLAGGFLRRPEVVERALLETRQQRKAVGSVGMTAHRNVYLLLTQEVYLEAIRFQLTSGVGSRGSAIVLSDSTGEPQNMLELDGQPVSIVRENEDFRNFTQETWFDPFDGTVRNRWVPRREIPNPDSWFENVWQKNRK